VLTSAGNMLSDALSTYTYDAENLISQPRVIREETGAQSCAGIPRLNSIGK